MVFYKLSIFLFVMKIFAEYRKKSKNFSGNNFLTYTLPHNRYKVSHIVLPFFSCQITSFACIKIFLKLNIFMNMWVFLTPCMHLRLLSCDFFWNLNIFIGVVA